MVKPPKYPLWLYEISDPNALLVVAHPDDETIFAGGLILSTQKIKWTIICCTTVGNIQREKEFFSACEFLSHNSQNDIQPISLNLALKQDSLINEQALINKLKAYETGFDIVFTHNSQGEYGHKHHKQVHHFVIESIRNPNTWVFISPGSSNVNQDKLRSKIPNGNFSLKLSPNLLKLKISTFQNCHASQAKLYGYDPIYGKLRDTDLKETLCWYFESPGLEEYTYYR